jgi:hypothetical protein
MNGKLDDWIPRNNLSSGSGIFSEDYDVGEHYEMPRKLDWNLFRKFMIFDLGTMSS